MLAIAPICFLYGQSRPGFSLPDICIYTFKPL